MPEPTQKERFLNGDTFSTPSSKGKMFRFRCFGDDPYLGHLMENDKIFCSVKLIDIDYDYITVAVLFFTAYVECNIYYEAMNFDLESKELADARRFYE